MKKQILKRHGNYILRTREIKNGFMGQEFIEYNWYYSKELHKLLKNQGFIHNYQLEESEDYHIYTYCLSYQLSLKLNFDFRQYFKEAQNEYIKDLLQYSNKTGKYAEIK